MKLERVKNTSRNLIYGIILQLFKLIVPFMMRTAILYLLGVQYLGLNSLFTSVLSVLNLAELGVGAAMVYSMYRPIVEDDEKKICALMQLYKVYYRIIGIVVAVVGLSLLPFIPYLIKGDIPSDISVYYLYLLNLGSTVLSYWLFAYKSSILQAHQRNDVVSKATLVTDVFKYGMQIIVLIVFKNYYYYVMAILISQIANNIITAQLASKMYPRYKAFGNLDLKEKREINRKIRDLFTAKVSTVVVYSSDTIVISAYLGLTTLAIYQNYYYLFTAVTAIIIVFFNSVRAGLGNSIIIDEKDKLFTDFKKLLFITAWASAFCSACFLCLYQPFMIVWVGKEYLLDFGIVIWLVIYFYVHCMNVFLNSYKDASGMWHEDRFRPLVEAITNLLLNLILVRYIGLYGIIVSTVFSMLFVAPWLIRNIFKLIFGTHYIIFFLKRLGYYFAVASVVVLITYGVCQMIQASPWLTVMIRILICMILTNVLYLGLCFKLPEFKQCMLIVERIVGRKK